jgi:rhodanese-related sulfurtransferase
MTTLTKLTPQDADQRISSGTAVLIDIREPDEYAREHIPGAISLPVSALDQADLKLAAGQHAIFHCKSGMRTDSNCTALAAHVDGQAFMMAGGLDAWRASGLPTHKDTKAPLEIGRQVQISAGLLVLLGIGLGSFVSPAWLGLSAFVGAGLMFAGMSGWCGMATLLQAMPWNKRQLA